MIEAPAVQREREEAEDWHEAQGREAERAAVVAYLRENVATMKAEADALPHGRRCEDGRHLCDQAELDDLADAIERGEHRK